MKRQLGAALEDQGLCNEEYQTLVEELMKDQPDQQLVRKLMLKQGIPYTRDPISQMSLVLQSLEQSARKMKDTNLI